MNNQRKIVKVDPEIDRLAKEIYYAEKEIYQGKNVKLNQDKIDNIMSTISFDKLMNLSLRVEEYTQHDIELKQFKED